MPPGKREWQHESWDPTRHRRGRDRSVALRERVVANAYGLLSPSLSPTYLGSGLSLASNHAPSAALVQPPQMSAARRPDL